MRWRSVLSLAVALLGVLSPAASAQGASAERNSSPPGLEKIIGGTRANPAEWPFIAALLEVNGANTRVFCGGALVAPQWVLTAAHCFAPPTGLGTDPRRFQILIGAARVDDPAARRAKALQIIVHPGYDRARMVNDLALVKLAAPVSGPTLPLSLSGASDPTGGLLGVAGYGSVQEGQEYVWRADASGAQIGLLSDGLRKTALPLQSTAECARRYAALRGIPGAERLEIGPAHLCAGYESAAKDTCQGDSGGPLLAYDGAGRGIGVGIVSYGFGCARPGVYGVYTRISAHAQFLRQAIPELAPAQWAKAPAFAAAPPEGLDQMLARLAPAKGRVRLDVCRIAPGVETPECGVKTVTLGDRLQLSLTSSVSGALVLIDVDPKGALTQVYPQPGAGPRDAWLEAGRTRVFREAGPGLEFAAVPPCGKGRFIAIVAPAGADLSAFVGGRGAATKGIGVVPARDAQLSDRTYAAELANDVVAAAERAGPTLPGWAWTEIMTDVRPGPADPQCAGQP